MSATVVLPPIGDQLAPGGGATWHAKLRVPAPPDRYLSRPSLEARVRDGARRRLLLVTGPSGQGKSSAVAAALDRTTAVVWVALEPSHQSPELLVRKVLTSLGELSGADLPTVTGADDPGEALLVAVEQLGFLSQEVVLVLDDDAAALGAASAQLVSWLLDRMPSWLHVVVLARHRPPLRGIERRRGRGEVAELIADELAFTDLEAAAYLRSWGIVLDAQALGRITDLAEGWPIALQLIAAWLHRSDNPREAVAALVAGDIKVARPLVDELLADLAAEDRRFLLDVAVLDDLEPGLCQQVSGLADSAERLARLAGEGLLVPAAAGQLRYRIRRLVEPLLRAESASDPIRRRALHAAAASAFADLAAWGPAIEHAIAAGDEPRALTWLEAHHDGLARQAGGAWLSGVLDQLSLHAVVTRPALLRCRADLGMVVGDRDGLERLLAALGDPRLDTGPRTSGLRRVRTYLSRLRGDGIEPLVRRRPTDCLEPLAALPLATALAAEGRHEAAAAAFRCALDDARGADAPLRELVVVADLTWQLATAGHLVDAELLGRRAAKLAGEYRLDLPLPVQLASAQVALDRGRPDVARARAASIRSAALLGRDLVVLADAALFESRARWMHGDVEGAIRALDQLDRDLSDDFPGGGLLSRIVRARASLRLALDDIEGAIALIPTITGTVEIQPPEDRLLAATVHLQRHQPHRAHELVVSLRDAGIGPRLTITALRLESAALGMTGDDRGALASARRADSVARVHGLLAVPARRRPATQGGQLLPAPLLSEDADGVRAPRGPAVDLTARELDVLRMLPSATNGEIASNLFVSVNTVKTHLKNLHRKLDVTTRDAAVLRGRELGLI